MPAARAFAIVVAASLAAPVIRSAVGPSGETMVYVGTYTDAGSRGIYRFAFDPASGRVGPPTLAGEAENPSFLALHPTGRFLYAVNELNNYQGQRTGAVSAFAIDADSGELRLLNRQPSSGTAPCHLVVDREGRHALVANYGSGNVAVLPIAPDGRLTAASSVRQHDGSGPNLARQAAPHAHGIFLDARERFALATDLGADRVFIYRFNRALGTLEPHGVIAAEPGAGPRHLAFDPAGRHFYVINELASTLTALAYDGAHGVATRLATMSTLPAGFTGENTTAEVVLAADGRFAYGSNRGHDSVAIFRVGSEGRLTPVGHVPVGGHTPRHIAIDPSGRWLLTAQQGSDAISVLRLDRTSGMPSATGAKVTVPKPACLVFVSH